MIQNMAEYLFDKCIAIMNIKLFFLSKDGLCVH